MRPVKDVVSYPQPASKPKMTWDPTRRGLRLSASRVFVVINKKSKMKTAFQR
jgi:hypothetical protein